MGGGKSLLFNGHVDTNPVTEGWTVDPWGGIVDERFIYGIGVSNMKAGDAAYFCAAKTLIDAGVRLKGDLILTYVVGELQGGVGTLALIDQGLRADYFINTEPTDLHRDYPSPVKARRGCRCARGRLRTGAHSQPHDVLRRPER
jgi:acetylornithine deacetylase